jgi:hypothetical protein
MGLNTMNHASGMKYDGCAAPTMAHEDKDEDVDEEKDDIQGGGGRTGNRTHCSELQHMHKELQQARKDAAYNATSAVQLANTSELSIQTARLLTDAKCAELEAQVEEAQAALAKALQDKKEAMGAIISLKAEKDEVARAADEAAAEAATALTQAHMCEHTMRKTVTALQDELHIVRQQGKEAFREAVAASTAANTVVQTKTMLAEEMTRKLTEKMHAELEKQVLVAHAVLMKEREKRKRVEQKLKDLLDSGVVLQIKTDDVINSLVEKLEDTRIEVERTLQQSAQAAANATHTMEVAQTRTQMAAVTARKLADVIHTELQSQVDAGHEALIKTECESKAMSNELIAMRKMRSSSQSGPSFNGGDSVHYSSSFPSSSRSSRSLGTGTSTCTGTSHIHPVHHHAWQHVVELPEKRASTAIEGEAGTTTQEGQGQLE